MSESLSLGKKGKFGDFDFSKIKSGIKKDELLKDIEPKMKSVFEQILNQIDANDDNTLTRNELIIFFNKIKELAAKKDDENLSTGEAKNFELENGKKLGRKGKDALFVLLNKLTDLSQGVKLTHNDDGTVVQEETVGNKTIITKFSANGDETEREETIKSAQGDVQKTFYTKGKKTKQYTTFDNGSTVEVTYDEDEKPQTKTVNQEGQKQEYRFNKEKKEWIPFKTTQYGEKEQVETEFHYKEDGTLRRETELTTRKGEEQPYRTINRSYGQDKLVNYEEIIENGKPVITREYKSDRSYTENYVEDGVDVMDEYNSDKVKTGQTRIKNGQLYEIKYDSEGNTLGIIVQNGETIRSISAKFDVTPEALIAANKDKVRGGAFQVGEEIKIPRRMDADEEVLQGRKTAEEAKVEYRAEQQRRAEIARQRREAAAAAAAQNGTQGADAKPEVRTRKKYDVATIQKESTELAVALHNQISGASLNDKIIGLLKTITTENVAFVVLTYQSKYGVSLAKDIDDEWGLDINTVKTHICKKLAEQAKRLGVSGVYFGDYQKINDIKTLQNWINNAAAKIKTAMANATEKYTVNSANSSQASPQAKATQKASAEQIVKDLIKATSGWNDVDAIKKIILRIDNPEELKEVNRLLALKGFNADEKYSPIENFIYKEANNSVVHTYNSSDYLEQTVQKWIQNGTLQGNDANMAQARMAVRVIFDGGDGFGTNCDKIRKGVRMIKCPKPSGNRAHDNKQAKAVYNEVNRILANHRTFYGLGSPSKNLRDYCEGEMWESECKYIDGILAENNAIQGKEKVKAVRDLTKQAVEGAGTDIHDLEQAIKAIDSPEDRKAIEKELEKYCKEKNIKPQIAGQSYLQAILYDECDTFMGISTDHKEIRKFNEMMISQGAYTEQEIVNLRAEQAALQILEGNFDNVMDAVQQIKDPKVYARLQVLLKTKGYDSLDAFLSKKMNGTSADLINAELAGNNILSNDKAVEVAFRLVKNSDFNKRAKGLMAIRNGEVARAVNAKLKAEGSSLAKVLEQFNKEKAEYKTKAAIWDGLAFLPWLGAMAENISDRYRDNTDVSDNMYVESKTAQNLTEAQKQSYKMAVDTFEACLTKMEADFKAALDGQGVVSGWLNQLCSQYNIGTTRDDIQARIEHDRETLRLLKLAAEGKLTKFVNGQEVAVSFEEVWKERQSEFVTANAASISGLQNAVAGKAVTTFDASKVEKVAKKAETIAAMDYAKDNIVACWDELSRANTPERYTTAIVDTMEKLSAMSGKKLSLAGFGYTIKDGVIVDGAGKPVSESKLREIVNQLKQGLADVSKALLGKEIPLNSNTDKVSGLLEDGYNSKLEVFKQEYRDAFGQEVPDEVIDNYMTTINRATMVVNIGVMIGAVIAAPFTGGGSLAVFALTAGASMGLNALEKSTDADGYTSDEWTADLTQAAWDGLLAASGYKIGQIAETFAKGGQALISQNKWLAKMPSAKAQEILLKAKDIAAQIESKGGKIGEGLLNAHKARLLTKYPAMNPATAEKAAVIIARAEAAGFEITSDTLQSLVQMYCMDGEFNSEQFLRDLLLSLGANAVGHSFSAVGDAKNVSKAEYTPPKGTSPDGIVPGEAKKMPDGTSQHVSSKNGVETVDTYYYDAEGNVIGQKAVINGETHYLDSKGNLVSETDFAKIQQIHDAKFKVDSEVPKTYAEMNEQELFAEYKRLDDEFKYGGLDTSGKAANINEMKKIKAELEAKGFSIQEGKLISTNKTAAPSNAADDVQTAPEIKIKEVFEKYGKKIGKRFEAVLNQINKIATQVDVDRVVKYLKEKFEKFPELIAQAKYYLVKQVDKLGLKIKDTSILVSPEMQQTLNAVAKKHNGSVLNVNTTSMKFKKGDKFVVDLASNPNTQLSLGGVMTLDLNEAKLKYLLEHLQEGESFYIGSWEGNAKYKFGSNQNGVSRTHLKVTKENGVFVFEDLSSFGTFASKNYADPVSSKDVKKMFNNNKIDHSYYINKVHQFDLNLDSDDYAALAMLMNKCDGRYIGIWNSVCLLDNARNIDKLAAFVKLVRKHGSLDFYLKLDARSWDNVVNNICQKTNSTVDAIYNYKSSSNPINKTLSAGYSNDPVIAGYINAMTEHINTQVINKKMHLYRGEQYSGTLGRVLLPNGQSVGDALEYLIRKNASQAEKNAFVNKYLVGLDVKQERFMSAALNEEFCTNWAKNNSMGWDGPNPNGAVVWDIDVESGTRGCFVEDYNSMYPSDEYEFILQRDSSLVIKGAYFDKNKNVWVIKAKIEQPDISDIKPF